MLRSEACKLPEVTALEMAVAACVALPASAKFRISKLTYIITLPVCCSARRR